MPRPQVLPMVDRLAQLAINAWRVIAGQTAVEAAMPIATPSREVGSTVYGSTQAVDSSDRMASGIGTDLRLVRST